MSSSVIFAQERRIILEGVRVLQPHQDLFVTVRKEKSNEAAPVANKNDTVHGSAHLFEGSSAGCYSSCITLTV